jgi:hypothetical protein
MPVPPPKYQVPCKDECKDGQEMKVNPITQEMFCGPCSSDTYSVGSGGILIDGRMGDWLYQADEGSGMPYRMDLSCRVYDLNTQTTYDKNTLCDPWRVTGNSIKAYKGHLNDTIVEFELTYAVYFATPGYVEFKYRKDGTTELGMTDNDYPLGSFKFYIDDQVVLNDIQEDDNPDSWKIFSYGNDLNPGNRTAFTSEHSSEYWNEIEGEIPEGFHILKWTYTKVNQIPLTQWNEAEIEVSILLLTLCSTFW